jgi:predicted membrane-bound spermidine synthase
MVIRHVGVWSVSRLYGALSAAMGLLIGACFALVTTLGGMVGSTRDSGSVLTSGGVGAMFGVGAIIIFPLLYGVLGLVGGAIAAALYNLFAGMFGGIELETEP